MLKKSLLSLVVCFHLPLMTAANAELDSTLNMQQKPESLQQNVATLIKTKVCEACYLVGADLNNVDLREANLNSANLQKASLKNADLTGADLSGADLREANLQGAKLIDALMINTVLFKAHLQDAQLPEMSEEELKQLTNEPSAAPTEAKRGIRG